MGTQRGLFDDPPVRPDPVAREVKSARRRSLDERFAEYHEAHPEVYELFKRFALQLWDAGRRRTGAKMIAERIRWEKALVTSPGEFKLNNSFVSRFARMLLAERPDLDGFFEFRKLRSRRSEV